MKRLETDLQLDAQNKIYLGYFYSLKGSWLVSILKQELKKSLLVALYRLPHHGFLFLLVFNRVPGSHLLSSSLALCLCHLALPFTCTLKRMVARNSAVYLGGDCRHNKISEERSQPHIWGLGEHSGRREGGAEANNGTHSHSASTYKFLVASLFSR